MTLLHKLVLQVEPVGVGNSPEPAKIHDVTTLHPDGEGSRTAGCGGGLWVSHQFLKSASDAISVE
jgi:hypothetical protein